MKGGVADGGATGAMALSATVEGRSLSGTGEIFLGLRLRCVCLLRCKAAAQLMGLQQRLARAASNCVCSGPVLVSPKYSGHSYKTSGRRLGRHRGAAEIQIPKRTRLLLPITTPAMISLRSGQ
jgi:hypothetical protein